MKHLLYKLMRRIQGIKIAVIISYKYDKDYLPDCIENIKNLNDVLIKLDPNWQFNAVGYLTDKTGMQLTAIEASREYLPPYRNDQMDKAIFDNV